MQMISCPKCGGPLPGSARYCASCGEDASSSDATLYLGKKRYDRSTSEEEAFRSSSHQDGKSFLQEQSETTLALALFRKEARAGLAEELQYPFDASLEEDFDDELVESNATWQKVVEHKTPPTLPVIVSAPSRPQKGTFHSLLPRFPRQAFPPRLFFWLSLLALLALLLGGTFGVALGFGREAQPAHILQPVLQASPETIALGGILTLRGTQFTHLGRIELTHDQQIPLVDTGGVNNIQADTRGTFSDTVIINPRWKAGRHVLYALDLSTHKQAAFQIIVTGQSALQGPPHLLLSSYALNLGSGDETTNSNKMLAISNAGGGQISWQASLNRPWLQISPKSGLIASGGTMSVIVAVERINLTPGDYTATIVITSNSEQEAITVSVKVVSLQPKHQAVLQLSPAALTFTTIARGPDPQSQQITIHNPGVRKLTWGTSMQLENDLGWLALSPESGEIDPGASATILANTFTQNLTPGVYKGEIIFSNQGKEAIQGSPQSVYISLTVAPLCTLTFTQNSLGFTATAGQANPSAQTLGIKVASGCTTSQRWSAAVSTTRGGKWLKTDLSGGSTPSQIQVSVATSGLTAGTYTGAVTFATSAGQQIVPISLTIRPVPPVPCTLTGSSALSLQGMAGQGGSVAQNAILDSSGSCPHTLSWNTTVSVATPAGGNWLSATSSGTLLAPATANVSIQGSLAGLSAGSYTGTVTVTAIDATTRQSVGSVHITVTLTVLAVPCALSIPSTAVLPFSASAGSDPAAPSQSFTLGVSGSCAGNVTITASGDAGSTTWLTIAPASNSVSSGGQATFTVTITSAAL
ncbi:MAG TPA: hypothetical protein VFN35_03700, partial [Ktedonobacteraceae bacterium]|nr:hypothetical protein [Ktedonobacteraceae bacterium]